MRSWSLCKRLGLAGLLCSLSWALSGCTSEPRDVPLAEDQLEVSGTGSITYGGISVATSSTEFSNGLEPGDRVLGWVATGGDGPLHPLSFALELFRVETEIAAQEPVALLVQRSAQQVRVDLGRRSWRATFEPIWTAEFGGRLEQILEATRAADDSRPFRPDQVLQDTEELIVNAADPIDDSDAAWVWQRVARALRSSAGGSPDATKAAVDAAHQKARHSSLASPYIGAQLDLALGIELHRKRDFQQSTTVLQQALRQFKAEPDARFATARTHYFLGQNALFVGDITSAVAAYRACLTELTPQQPSLAQAACTDRLGQSASMRGNLDQARRLFADGLAVREQIAPGSLEVASSLNGLGTVAARSGDLATAESLFEQVLAIRQQGSPDTVEVSDPLTNLGYVAARRGDLAKAEGFYLASLAVMERVGENELGQSYPLNNLANVSRNRGELVRAKRFGERALAIRKANAPGSRMVATSLLGLASTHQNMGAVEAATALTEQALLVARAQAPGSVLEANVLGLLGELQTDQELWEQALGTCRQVAEIYERRAPTSGQAALSLSRLAQAQAALGVTEATLELAERADRLAETVAAGTIIEAETKHAVADIYALRGDTERALPYFAAAVAAIEQQGRRSGIDERGLDTFRSQHQMLYDDLLEAQLAAGQPQAAFETLERSRARSMVAMLLSRDLLFRRDLPAELLASYRGLLADYERLRRQRERSTSAEQALDVAREQSQLEQHLAEVEDTIASEAPRYAALIRPETLSFDRLVAALAPGTLHLAYSVQSDKARLFVLDASGTLDVYQLPYTEHRLEREVEIFRTLLISGSGPLAEATDSHAHAGRLFDLLLAPAAERVARAERLTISSDGPLHLLPFSALRIPVGTDDAAAERQYLVESVSVVSMPSLTVQHALQLAPISKDLEPVLAFGDPVQTDVSEESSHTGPVRDLRQAPLPWSREEVKLLRGFFPGRARVLLGAAATEARAKSLPDKLAVLHFATHAVADDLRPLDSALLLARGSENPDATEDGVLYAWEVFEQVKVQADLVTLSGCDTGLGGIMTGEGLVGLTRAFQYAGAASVISSLWQVSDRSTTELMRHLYRHLVEGDTKDVALRKAQIDIIRGQGERRRRGVFDSLLGRAKSSLDPSISHPYHWAGFQLYGGWQ